MRFFVDGSIKTPITEYLTNPKYQQVEYLESTGTQYIDTGYTQTSTNIKFEIHVYTPNIPSTEQDICGYAVPDNFGLLIGLFQHMVFFYTRKNSSTVADSNVYSSYFSGENDFIISGETNESLVKTLTVNGTVYTGLIRAQLTNFQSIKLFMANPAQGRFLGRIYYFKIWDSSILVRDFTPAIRKEDGKPGMYDKVSGQFFTNVGTGEFLYGNPVYNSVPKGYKECEYLESTGTQYIDTEVDLDQYTIYEGEFELNENYSDYSFSVFGGGLLDRPPSNRICFQSGYVTFWNGARFIISDVTATSGEKINFKIENDKFTVNDSVKNITNSATTNGQPAYMFAYNNLTAGVAGGFVKAKFYNLRIKKGGSFVRDYVPALREADNEPGMYDRVSNTFFANKGTGTFKYKLKERQTEKVTRILYSGSKMRLVRNPTA